MTDDTARAGPNLGGQWAAKGGVSRIVGDHIAGLHREPASGCELCESDARRPAPARLSGLLREAAEEAHLFGPDHDRRPFDECRYEPCVKRRAALAADEPGLG